ncbi:MAG: heavy metal translocating P-type ATPase [Bacillota bacterium]|nr:heavy metal translocating P-type ATPase [Bacillota bacterium]
MNKKQKKMLKRIIISSILMVIFKMLPVTGYVEFGLFMIPYLVIGYDILKKAWKGILNKQVFDENFLMAVATIGAICLGDYVEGAAVMLFYQIGELFQSYAVGKSRKNISELMDIRPDYANVEDEDGNLEQVDPDEVAIGTIIVVKPGEKIPIDGIVVEGKTTLNTAALTGESVPRDVHEGDEVISGCINLNGLLKIQTTKEFGESTVSKILDLVENASSKKSKSEAFISKFARYYTPAVCYGALFLAIVPPVVSCLFLHIDPNWPEWIFRALTFLVISCPCALVISIPLSFFAGIGGASNAGVLVKGSNYLEALASAKTVVFDKTGTLTEGVFEVTGIHHTEIPEVLLEYAAYAESYSTHPISKSLLAAYKKEIDQTRVSDVEEISGHGVKAIVDGHVVLAGNKKLMNKFNISCEDCSSVGTVVHVGIDGEYAGHILISDIVKKHSKEAIRGLKKLGIKKVVMLTGDMKNVAQEVAQELGVDEVYGELLPQDKVEQVETLLEKKAEKDKLVFVGDGINDAPVLTRADIGVAMGALGSDAAIEAADIVLMDDDPLSIVKAIRIAKKCIRIVYQNIYFAIGVKLLCLALGAFGLANMWLAIFADVGVMIIAVLNAIRTLNVKNM